MKLAFTSSIVFALLSLILIFQVGPSNIFGGQVVVPANDKVEFLQAPVLTDFSYSCPAPAYRPLCTTILSLLALNDSRVDAIFTANHIRVTNPQGNIIFPRAASIPAGVVK